MITRLSDEQGYAAKVAISAPIEHAFAAQTNLDGLAGWWTLDTSGSPSSGGGLTFGFGPDKAELSVDKIFAPVLVIWMCVRHSKISRMATYHAHLRYACARYRLHSGRIPACRTCSNARLLCALHTRLGPLPRQPYRVRRGQRWLLIGRVRRSA
jgi:hypothetical protein